MTIPIYYSFDPFTHEYSGARLAPLDPLETAAAGKAVYERPGEFETVAAAPFAGPKAAVCFIQGAWQILPDHRKEIWFRVDDGSPVVIEGLGEPADHGLVAELPPAPTTADDVRAEAQRRIIEATGATDLTSCLIKQLNALMRATALNDKRLASGSLSEAEEVEAAALRALSVHIEKIRAASSALETDVPNDYTDGAYWPEPLQ
jgi:hypothetical protein